MFCNQQMTEFEICKLALVLERQFNPYTGYQDPYGCGIGGFKRIDFAMGQVPIFRFFESKFLHERFDMGLYHTGVFRGHSSSNVLATIDITKAESLLDTTLLMSDSIQNDDTALFLDLFNKGWTIKKQTTRAILEHDRLKSFDQTFNRIPGILGAKLCGAGNGGYFFVIAKKNCLPSSVLGATSIPVVINDTGVCGVKF